MHTSSCPELLPRTLRAREMAVEGGLSSIRVQWFRAWQWAVPCVVCVVRCSVSLGCHSHMSSRSHPLPQA